MSHTPRTDRRWKWRNAVIAYRFHAQQRVTAGFASDSSPVSDANRTVAPPLDRTFRYPAGRIYDSSDRMTVGLAYRFMDVGSAAVNETCGPLSGRIQGDLPSNDCHVVALSVASRF
jgi:long-subunit fatty acid transport protein